MFVLFVCVFTGLYDVLAVLLVDLSGIQEAVDGIQTRLSEVEATANKSAVPLMRTTNRKFI